MHVAMDTSAAAERIPEEVQPLTFADQNPSPPSHIRRIWFAIFFNSAISFSERGAYSGKIALRGELD